MFRPFLFFRYSGGSLSLYQTRVRFWFVLVVTVGHQINLRDSVLVLFYFVRKLNCFWLPWDSGFASIQLGGPFPLPFGQLQAQLVHNSSVLILPTSKKWLSLPSFNEGHHGLKEPSWSWGLFSPDVPSFEFFCRWSQPSKPNLSNVHDTCRLVYTAYLSVKLSSTLVH